MSRLIVFLIFFSISTIQCKGQVKPSENEKVVGGPCEGCEAIFETSFDLLTPLDTLPGHSEYVPQLELTGTVYKTDSKTPAMNVVVYIYHTDQNGIYFAEHEASDWGKRHGKYRGWIKTDKNGKYTFHTFMPAAYPERKVPNHIHLTVKEPGYSAYYIDEIIFNDDPLLSSAEKNSRPDRGGSGLVYPRSIDGKIIITRDIILGYNIPDYE